ncbi:MAG: hypothetical protein WAK50_11520 [Nitrososphaeraceae archaeon]|jgi:hypothetical protein
MTADLPKEMRNPHLKAIIVFLVVLSLMVPTSLLSINDSSRMNMALGFGQPTDESEANVVQIVKDSMTSYNIVNNETEFLGAFDTTYTISGNSESLKGAENAIISAVRDDLNKSPTIGYIKAGIVSTSSSTDPQAPDDLTLPNPFVDSATVNQSISLEVSNAIESVASLDAPIINIKCDFDMYIENWQCVNQGLNPS